MCLTSLHAWFSCVDLWVSSLASTPSAESRALGPRSSSAPECHLPTLHMSSLQSQGSKEDDIIEHLQRESGFLLHTCTCTYVALLCMSHRQVPGPLWIRFDERTKTFQAIATHTSMQNSCLKAWRPAMQGSHPTCSCLYSLHACNMLLHI